MTTRMLTAGTALGLVMATGAVAQTSAPGASAPLPTTASAPVVAAAGGGVAQGAAVSDPQGGSVGTIESVDGDFVVLATAKSKVRLPKSSFANGPKGPVIAMTATQIDQAAAQAAPPTPATTTTPTTKATVAKGAAVADTQGGAVGTVAEADAQFATVQLTTGAKVRLPVNAFAAGPDGKLRIAMTAAQLSAAASAAGSSTTPGGASN